MSFDVDQSLTFLDPDEDGLIQPDTQAGRSLDTGPK